MERRDSTKSDSTGSSSLLASGQSVCVICGTKLLKDKFPIKRRIKKRSWVYKRRRTRITERRDSTKSGSTGSSDLLAHGQSFFFLKPYCCVGWKNYCKANFQLKDVFKAKCVLQEKEI